MSKQNESANRSPIRLDFCKRVEYPFDTIVFLISDRPPVVVDLYQPGRFEGGEVIVVKRYREFFPRVRRLFHEFVEQVHYVDRFRRVFFAESIEKRSAEWDG